MMLVKDVANKNPGHVILLETAQAITRAPLARMSDSEKYSLESDLQIQLLARIRDIIPEDKISEVIEEVLVADMLLNDRIDTLVMVFVRSLADNAEIERIMMRAAERVEEEWLIVTADDAGTYFVSADAHRNMVEAVAKLGSQPRGLISSIARGLGLEEQPSLRVVWSSHDKSEDDAAGDNEASGDAEGADDDKVPGDAGRLSQ